MAVMLMNAMIDEDGFSVPAAPLDHGEHLIDAVREHIYYAFQPIVSMQTGRCFGFEALLRGQERLGFPTIASLFDHAHEHGFLHRMDLVLRDKAIGGFVDVAGATGARLFFNLDNRVIRSPDYQPSRTAAILSERGVDPATLCFELSELHALTDPARAEAILRTYRSQHFLLAIDDFGTGFSGLKLMYEHQPDLIKIDRFFIANICSDHKKKLFVSSIVNLAHVLGITVVAEGVETDREFSTCKQIGCDLVQGYFISPPTAQTASLNRTYEVVAEINRRDRRDRRSDEKLVREELEPVPPLGVDSPMSVVFDTFRRNKEQTFFPIVDERRQPLGIVREAELKDFIYSQYGKDLLSNKSCGKGLRHFLSRCPICDINTEAEKILAIYSLDENPAGIIIVENFQYAGVLSAASLLRVINEKNLALARDQNPLTKLPGNNSIIDHVTAALEDVRSSRVLVHFDLDNFKPFNDTFGFRQGDRAILMFADLMRSRLTGSDVFLGHIGGDDFFAGFCNVAVDLAITQVSELLAHFSNDAEIFYDAETRRRGFILAKDREGTLKRFPLLTCSAALVEIPAGPRDVSTDHLLSLIADLKKAAKRSREHLAVHRRT